jgi:hypothetical protein
VWRELGARDKQVCARLARCGSAWRRLRGALAVMRSSLLALVLIASTASAGEPLVWSSYSKDMHLVSVSEDKHEAHFEGRIAVTGTLVIELNDERSDAGLRSASSAVFYPDDASRSLLPAVVGGLFPAPVAQVTVGPLDGILVGALGRARASDAVRGNDPAVIVTVKVILDNMATSVVSDARVYRARVSQCDVRAIEAKR